MRGKSLIISIVIILTLSFIQPICYSVNIEEYSPTTKQETPSPLSKYIVQLTDNQLYDSYPLISDNGQILWRVHVNGSTELFFWDGSVIKQITYTPYDEHFYSPQNKNQINYSGHCAWRGRPASYDEVFYWNGTTVIQLTNNSCNNGLPTINDNGWITWHSKINGPDYEIMLWDGNTISQITDNDINDYYPQINNNGQIAWHGNNEIYIWNGISTIQLTDNNYSDIRPQISDLGHLVWTGIPEVFTPDIFYWNGNEVIRLTNNSFWDYDVDFNNNGQIVWCQQIESNGTEESRIMLWESNTTSLISDKLDNYNPKINDNGQVVWFQRDVENTSVKSEIIYWHGGSPIQLTFNDYHDYNPQINELGQVVWYGKTEEGDCEIFLFSNPTELEQEYNVTLSAGWSLIALPLVQYNETIDTVLNSINGKWDCIQTYDPLSPEPWKSTNIYRPDQLNDITTLDHTMAFWINITEPNVNLTVSGYIPTSTTIPLYAGWNLVGYPTTTEKTVADALWGTGADKVEVYDSAEPYRIREVGPTYMMKPGEGYWVHVPIDTMWVVDW